ncbi:hypothetical protein LCGC14_2337970 [marine sediment metagenome]|uniref:Uncharacterized protein n=1 Tax=marine sediment metagenome TaxID=412755 RepID=A0A0F9CCR6_9ZZZZ
MKWKYDMELLDDIATDGGLLERDRVEALRAIAEQLERIAGTAEFAGKLTLFGLEQLAIVLEDRDDPAAERLESELERLRAYLT